MKLLIAVFALLLFLICGLIGLINRIIAFRTRSKLKIASYKSPAYFRHKLSISDPMNLSNKEMKDALRSLLKMFITFGSKESTRGFLNNYYDVKAITDSDEEEIKDLLARSIRLDGNFAKCWVVMMATLVLAALSWDVN